MERQAGAAQEFGLSQAVSTPSYVASATNPLSTLSCSSRWR